MPQKVPSTAHDVDQLNQTALQIGEFLNHPYTVFISGKVAHEVLTGFSYQIAHKESEEKNNPFAPLAQSRIRDLLLASVAGTPLKSCELMIESEDGRRYACTIPHISDAIERRFLSGPDMADLERGDTSPVDKRWIPSSSAASHVTGVDIEVTIRGLSDHARLPDIFDPHVSILHALDAAYPNTLFDITISVPETADPASSCIVLNLLRSNGHDQTALPTREDLEKVVTLAASCENIDSVFVRISTPSDSRAIELPKIDNALDALCTAEAQAFEIDIPRTYH